MSEKRADRTPTPAFLDPFLRLAAGILNQAVTDLRDPDPVKSVDSLIFWIDPAGAAPLMAALDMPDDPDLILERLCRGKGKRTV